MSSKRIGLTDAYWSNTTFVDLLELSDKAENVKIVFKYFKEEYVFIRLASELLNDKYLLQETSASGPSDKPAFKEYLFVF